MAKETYVFEVDVYVDGKKYARIKQTKKYKNKSLKECEESLFEEIMDILHSFEKL